MPEVSPIHSALNRYNGSSNDHKPSTIAPVPFYAELSEELSMAQCRATHQALSCLEDVIGKPYFSDNGFILYHGDSPQLLAEMTRMRLSVNLTLTSPPYNIGKEYEPKRSISGYIEWCEHWLDLIYQLTDNKGSFWLNLGYLQIPEKGKNVPIPYLLWDKTRFFLMQEVVWKYGAGVAAKKYLSPRNEKWLYYVKDPDNYVFNLDDIRDPNVKYPNSRKNGKLRCNPAGKNPSDVWEFPKVTSGMRRSSRERTGHPAQFPLSVVERIIKASSAPADTVLDPFSGSSSAGIAAYAFGRVYVGIEASEEYCALSVERYKSFKEEKARYISQSSLFRE